MEKKHCCGRSTFEGGIVDRNMRNMLTSFFSFVWIGKSSSKEGRKEIVDVVIAEWLLGRYTG